MTTAPVISLNKATAKSWIALILAVSWIAGFGSAAAIFLSVSEIRRAKREGNQASIVNYIALALGIIGVLLTVISVFTVTESQRIPTQ